MPAPAWMFPCRLGDHGADGDAGVEIAGEVGVEDCAAVDAAAGGLELFDDLHGADFGRAGEGAGGEAGAQGVDGAEVRAELALDGADQVHDVAVALDEHEAIDLDGAVFADAAYVVAAEVDEHDVLGALLFVGEHFGFEGAVFGFVGAALAGAGDGAVFDFAPSGVVTRTSISGEEPATSSGRLLVRFGEFLEFCVAAEWAFGRDAQVEHVGARG